MELDDEEKSGKANPPEREGGKRTAVSVKDDLLGDIEFDLIDEEIDSEDTINDVFARDTAIPAPSEHLSADTIRPAEDVDAAQKPAARHNPKVPAPPPPARAPQHTPTTIEPPSEDLEFDSFDPPVDVFGQPIPGTQPLQLNPRAAFGHSEMPTAPPQAPRGLPEQAKRSLPATPEPRGRRPAFLAETARNPPAEAELLARATMPGGSSSNGRAVGNARSEPNNDSALDFVDAFEPELESAPPSAKRPPIERAEPPSSRPRAGPREMQECYAVGDFSRALSIAEDILARTPDDMVARRCAQNCRDVLTQMFAARIGPLDQVISVAVSPDEVQWLALDHRAGFLLSLVDGHSTVDEILDISGMTRLDALKIIFDLTERQVVRLA
jgi:hypothetical protein